MTRRFEGGKLVVASHNPGKLREIEALLQPFGAEPISAGVLGLPEPVEDGADYIANARIKAHAAAKGAGLPALSDDSGFSVAALGGAPGVYSARWAGPGKDFALAMETVWQKLQASGVKPPFKAEFICALCLAWPDGHEEVFEGRVRGEAVWPPRGDKGFGYDPMFVADGMTQTFAEIDPTYKQRISHRANAFTQLLAACFGDPA